MKELLSSCFLFECHTDENKYYLSIYLSICEGSTGFSLDSREMVKTSFLLILSVWVSHDSTLSMSTPRYLILLHWSNSWLPMCTFRSVSVMCDSICLVVSSITFDFDVLMTSLCDSYHSCTSVTHFWILVFSSTMLLPLQYINVSPA